MESFQWVGVVGVALMSAASALHALLSKRESTAAFAWIAVCFLFPVLGPIMYFLLGINRIRTRARELRGREAPLGSDDPEADAALVRREFVQQARISRAITGLPLTHGNRVTPYQDGDNAYPAMLEAIAGARERIYLATYIFESNRTGRQFADALGAARERGVVVRVLLDGAGEWYSFPRIRWRLRRLGVRVGRFLPPKLLPPSLVLNLRNHRKIMVVDGRLAFTGGMNIGDRHLVERDDGRHGIHDLHFRLDGPVVAQIEAVFREDWRYTTGETLPHGPEPAEHPDGTALGRAIIDGPNEDLDRLGMIINGAVAAARSRVVIMTPYFLPPREMIGALQSAAVRGIRVDVILPAHNNLAFMHWATQNMLWELLKWGVRVYYRQGPFAHTKLFLVDEQYVQIGSANLDPRSLRLNFELAVELYDPAFGRELAAEVARVIGESREVTLAELDGRSLPARVRDAICWLFTPYL